MLRMSLLFLAALLIPMQSGGLHVFVPHHSVVVYWLTPEAETYVAIMPSMIEDAAIKVVELRDQEQVHEALALIHRSQAKMDDEKIRVKIKTEDKSYYFDQKGDGVSTGGEAVSINLQKLKVILKE